MHILITGAAGMIGRKLTDRLVKAGTLNGGNIEKLTLIDVVPPTVPAQFSGDVSTAASDLAGPGRPAAGGQRAGSSRHKDHGHPFDPSG